MEYLYEVYPDFRFPSNKICPKCNTGYVFYTQKYLKGEDTKYIAICTNCSYLFIKDEYSMTILDSEE